MSRREALQEDALPDTAARFRMEEVVRRTGLTPRAIRYYEEMGLLSPSGRTAGGFRLFDEAEIAQLIRIKELQALLGFSLAEIKETLHADTVRVKLRQAYAKATNPGLRRELVDQEIELVQSKARIIDERMARLEKLHEEYQERLSALRSLYERITHEQGTAPAVHDQALLRDSR
jgi:MerR family transcriptional regulator, repressor of the yfmOP operon